MTVHGFVVADRAQAGIHQLVHRDAGRRRHVLEGQPLAAARDVAPVEALRVAEGEGAAPPALGGQRRQPRGGGGRDRRARSVGRLGERAPAQRPGDSSHRRAV